MADFVNEKLNVDTPEKVRDTITPQVGGSANIKLQESVERARIFNNNLELEKSSRSIHEIGIPIIKKIEDSHLIRINQVLKEKGMDSQQRIQAMHLIEEILRSV